jgi:hypothetical protein
MDYAKNL